MIVDVLKMKTKPPDKLWEEIQYESLYKKQDCETFNESYKEQEDILLNKGLDKFVVERFMTTTWKPLQLEHRCNYCFGDCNMVIVR